MRNQRRYVVLALALAAARADACGFCIEDRAAVVYDHAVVERARANRHHVAFFALDGTAALAKGGQRRFIDLANSAAGVYGGSARVSLEPVSLLLAFDAERVSLLQLQVDLERRFAAENVALRFLQVLDPLSQVSGVSK